MTERTLAIIKPDAVERRLAGRILLRIEEAGFQIRAMRRLQLSKRQAEGFYAVHRERPFFQSLTTFMSSGPCVVIALEAEGAIAKWRGVMGATDPAKADTQKSANENSTIASAAPTAQADPVKAAATKADTDGASPKPTGCKRYFPTIGQTLSVPCD